MVSSKQLRRMAIEEFTTPSPITVNKNTPIKEVIALMQENEFRHVPIVDGSNIVGVISDRDIKLAASVRDINELIAQDIMTKAVYVVPPETPIHEVALDMSKNKYGSAIIQTENGEFLGIFTVTDALNALVEILRGEI